MCNGGFGNFGQTYLFKETFGTFSNYYVKCGESDHILDLHEGDVLRGVPSQGIALCRVEN